MYKDGICKLCGKVFLPIARNQKYCSVCKEKAEKRRVRECDRKKNNYQEYTRRCKICGKKFTTYYKKKVYCGSDECEKERCRRKNERAQAKRSKRKLRKKGQKYYKDNKEKCLLRKAEAYREKHPSVKDYEPGRISRHSIESVREYVVGCGYSLLSSVYTNNRAPIILLCPKGHEWTTTFHAFKDGGARCFHCYIENNYISKPEQRFLDYFRENYPSLKLIHNDREQIKPKELDLYFPEQRVAVEVCGLYWHSEVLGQTPRNHHYKKMMECFEKGIRLITVFEDEINNQFDVVVSRILQALGVIKNRIYARKCIVEEIGSKEANQFFEKYHLQGKAPAKKAWGLFYKNELVAACSVGKVTRKHTSTGDTLELKRFCSLPDIVVVGGASRLFKKVIKFTQDEGYTLIKSYCDMRYANIFNPVYEILSFELVTETKYTPHYFRNGVRYRNMSLRKTPEERRTSKTEFELRQEQGYDRIWDCGHKTYIYKI